MCEDKRAISNFPQEISNYHHGRENETSKSEVG
jgi:hypothetical protein